MSLVDQLIHLPPCHYCVRQQLREKRGSEITQVQLLGAEEHREEISCDDSTDDGRSMLELDSEFSRTLSGAKSLVQSRSEEEEPLKSSCIMLKIETSESDELHSFRDRRTDTVAEQPSLWMDPVEDSSSTSRDQNSRLSMSSMCTCCFSNAAQLCELLFLQFPLQQILCNALSLQIAMQLYQAMIRSTTMQNQSSTKRRRYDADVVPSRQAAAKKQRLENRSSDTSATFLWETLPQELEDKVLANLSLQDLYRTRTVSKSFNQAIHRGTFRHARRLQQLLTTSSTASTATRATHDLTSEGSFSPIFFFANELGTWEWSGYDLNLHEWRKLPTLSACRLHLPSPDRRALKNFFVSGSDGLLCINVANPFESPFEKLIVCNPLTQSTVELPPLNFRRHPVLMHVVVNHATNSFMILVAGSSCMGSEHLCRKTEVYDSLTSSWEVVADLPGPEFALNEYQVGVNSDGIVYCIALISSSSQTAPDQAAGAESHCSKGLLAYSLKEKTWSSSSSCILPRLRADATFATTQLLEGSGSIYLFSEQEMSGNCVHFCIAKLEEAHHGLKKWTLLVDEKRKGYSRGLLVYPEYICLPHGEGKLCVFSSLEHTVVVYDLNSNTRESLPPPPPNFLRHGTEFSKLHTLNPLTFVFRPSFQTPI
ncbi:unnamed protein product [Sphagnum jensenii]|uniref:F-box domain-containing protein n=1 Tax=Sphagnum jensenii TaxID=128206 RepID=A0ABP0W2N4_9BRYO